MYHKGKSADIYTVIIFERERFLMNNRSFRLKAFAYLFSLFVIFAFPAVFTSAAEAGVSDEQLGFASVSGTESELPEGAFILERAPISAPEDSSDTSVYDASLTTGTLRSLKSGSSLYSLSELGGNEFIYNSLSDNQKLLFDAMGERIEAFIDSDIYKTDLNSTSSQIETRTDCLTKSDLSDKEIAETICRFVYANPQYYWIGTVYSFAGRDSYVHTIIYVDPCFYSYSTRKQTDDAIRTKTDIWVNEINEAASMGEFYGALKAHDIIIEAIDYSYNSSGQPELSMWAHSIAGVFTGQGAVCEGYSKCFSYLLSKSGINNLYILGTGSNEAHAWNAVQIANQWYLCDVTWDDPNNSVSDGLKDSNYSYFCIPESKFNLKHTAWDDPNYYGYELPDFEDTMDQSFFTIFDCYSDEAFTEATGESFAASVLEHRYRDIDYVFVAFPSDAKYSFANYVAPYLTGLDSEEGYHFTESAIGSIVKYALPVIETPAESISVSKESCEIELSESVSIRAILSEGSDDRVVWSARSEGGSSASDAGRFVQISMKGLEAVVTGRGNGTVILTATTYSSLNTDHPISASCRIKIGTGVDTADSTIWQNGTKDNKKTVIETKLSASTWKNSKGKIKSGKLVWFVTDKPTTPRFDSGKHTVSFSVGKSKLASINSKGVVTAKKAGTVYAYVCDTGSMTFEEHVIDIAAGPTKLFLTSVPNSTNKDNILKKIGTEAGSVYRVFITPFIKDGVADSDCTYTVRVAKPEQEQYLSVGKVLKDDFGNPYFLINALDFNRVKAKTATAKVEVVCDQTGKKGSMTVVVANPVVDASCKDPVTDISGADDRTLARKGSTVTLKLYLTTALEGVDITTDKIKIYVGMTDVSLNDRDKVEAEKGATVRAKFDKNTMTITLKASKDAGKPALVTAAFTNPLTKEINLIDLAEVDEDGSIKVW